MVIRITSSVATIIQATSPLLATGAAAGAAAEAASAGVAAMAAADAASVATGAEGAAPCASDGPAKPRTARPRARVAISFFMVGCLFRGGRASERVLAGLAGADAHHLLERRDEDLSVADLAGPSGRLDGFDDAFDDGIV